MSRRLALLAGAWLALGASAVAAVECRVEIDPEWKLYIVTRDGRLAKDVRYVTFDDAVRLRDFFISTGECRRAADPGRCGVAPDGQGGFNVVRNGHNFDPKWRYATFKSAADQARRMASAKLCRLDLRKAEDGGPAMAQAEAERTRGVGLTFGLE